MSKSFYNEYYATPYDSTGSELSSETERVCREIFMKYFDQGYSPREISHIMQSAISVIEATETLKFAMEKYKEKKAKDLEALKEKNPEFFERLMKSKQRWSNEET